MRQFVIALGCGCFLIGFVIWLRGQITYRVGREFLRVMVFNLTLCKVPLASITRVSTRLRGPAKNWANTFWPSHRQLVVHYKDSKRPLLITPANRYVVKAELQRILGTTASDDETAFRGREDGDDEVDVEQEGAGGAPAS